MWLLVLLFSFTEGEAEHLKCLRFPASQPKTHQKEKDNNQDHGNDEVFAFKKFRDAKRFGIIVVQLAEFLVICGMGNLSYSKSWVVRALTSSGSTVLFNPLNSLNALIGWY